MKKCRRCLVEKAISEFCHHPDTRGGLQSHCRKCQNEARRARRKTNPILFRNEWYQRAYGITADDYAQLLKVQSGKCKICGAMLAGDKRHRVLSVDHNHETGQVRGLLCVHCNHGLAAFRDNPCLLEAAIAYLKESRHVASMPEESIYS